MVRLFGKFHSLRSKSSSHYWKKQLFATAKFCFHLTLLCSSTFFIIPLVQSSSGLVTMGSKKRRFAHYIVSIVLVLLTLHKLWLSALEVSSGVFDIRTCVQLSSFFVSLISWSFAVGPVLRPFETMTLQNSWRHALHCCAANQDSPLPEYSRIFGSVSVAMQVTCLTWLAGSIGAIGGTVGPLVFLDLPVWMSTIIKKLIVPYIGIPSYALTTMLLPVDVFSLVLPLSVSTYSINMLFLSVGVLRALTKHVSHFRIEDYDGFRQAQRKILAIYVYNQALNRCSAVVLFPMLFSVSANIIVCLYIILRHQEISTFVYLMYLIVTIGDIGLVVWIAHESFRITKASEDSLFRLRRLARSWDDVVERKELMRTAKCLRPVAFSISGFFDFSYTLPVRMWEEILNQLMFLFTF